MTDQMTDLHRKDRLHRLGPRPLPLHLATAMAAWSNSLAGLRSSRNDWPHWRPDLVPEAEALAGALETIPTEELTAAIGREAGRRFEALVTAILRYRHAPPRRVPEPVPEVWNEGSSRLLDYGSLAPGGALPVLVVPSLINRSYVLDLLPQRSFLRDLAALSLRPILLDWGAPGPSERDFALGDYIGRLDRALDRAAAMANRPVAVIGYCMGGLLGVASAVRRPQYVSALVLLATPWDFHAEHPERAGLAAAGLDLLEPMLAAAGELPVDILQALFWALDPLQTVRKFVAFAKVEETSPAAEQFVALEDWVNDGVPLSAPVFRECLGSWYARNDPALGRWKVDGDIVDPDRVECPSLVMVPHRDRIVPPASATALNAALPQSDLLRPRAGHVGMVAGSRAREEVIGPVARWLRDRSG